MPFRTVIHALSDILKKSGSVNRKISEDKYLKVISSYGMTHPQRRKIFKSFYHEYLKDYSQEELRDLGFALLQEEGFDEKFEGIECLVKICKKMTVDDFKLLEPIIDNYVFDWATCDNLSCHVLSPAMSANPLLLSTVQEWKSGPSWRQRAACVSYLYFARRDLHTEKIFDICEQAVLNPFRFTQLGVGWVLRDVSVHHPDQVIAFLRQHRNDMSKEGVRYAVEKMSPSQKARVRAPEDE